MIYLTFHGFYETAIPWKLNHDLYIQIYTTILYLIH